jgi:hypothetical protein
MIWALVAAVEDRGEIPLDVRHLVSQARQMWASGNPHAPLAIKRALLALQALGIEVRA